MSEAKQIQIAHWCTVTGGTDIDYWNIGEDSSQMKSLTILEDDPEKLIKLSDTIQGLVDETIYILIKINDIHYLTFHSKELESTSIFKVELD